MGHFLVAWTIPPTFLNDDPKLRALNWGLARNGQNPAQRPKTARRVAKRPPTGKPKLSKVTSGYGGLIIPLNLVRLSQKMEVSKVLGVFMVPDWLFMVFLQNVPAQTDDPV